MAQVVQLVDSLFTAYETRQPIDKSVMVSGLDVEQAYHIQHAAIAKRLMNKERLVGYKISMTSPQTMALFDSDEPMYGQITSRQRLDNPSLDNLSLDNLSLDDSPANAKLTAQERRIPSTLSLSKQINYGLIELELAFVPQQKLLVTDTPQELCEKCLIAPCLEIPDSRFTDWFPKMSKEHLCADAAVGGYVCLGEAVPASYTTIANEIGSLYLNDARVLSEPATTVLDHPAYALHWLVKKLDSHGLHINPGLFISSGSFGMPIPLVVGEYVGEFRTLGNVRLRVEP